MTSDCAGDQNSQGPNGPNSVQATSTIGGHDRLNEAPRCQVCGRKRYVIRPMYGGMCVMCSSIAMFAAEDLRDGHWVKRQHYLFMDAS